MGLTAHDELTVDRPGSQELLGALMLSLLMFGLTGCDEGTFTWRAQVQNAGDVGRADRVLYTVLDGGCSGSVIWQSLLMRGDPPPNPDLPGGRYGFTAEGLSASCGVVARSSCDERVIGEGDVNLSQVIYPAMDECPTRCAEGCQTICAECAPDPLPEAGTDASMDARPDVRDATPDVMMMGPCGAPSDCAPEVNASRTCEAGECVYTCREGWGRCGGETCTVDLTVPTNCGSCDNVCTGESLCSDGECTTECASPMTECGGACVDIMTSSTHCGACDEACDGLANATAACAAGSCTIDTCDAGFDDCDGDISNGCEAGLGTSEHCGGCGDACAASESCDAGTCRMVACTAPMANCDGVSANGCEVDTSTSALHCGECGTTCATTCTAGECDPCPENRGDCDGEMANGCEVNFQNNPAHCGECGVVCDGMCVDGECAAVCPEGQGDCDSDPANGCEVDLTTSDLHCGECANSCPEFTSGPSVCMSGECVATCTMWYGDCDGLVVNGCEKVLQTDVMNCGECGMVCASGQTCVLGVCTDP